MNASEIQLMKLHPELFDCECHVNRAQLVTTIVDKTSELAKTTDILVQVSSALKETMQRAIEVREG
jgi:hypothetical protein